MPLLSRS